ncbi:hypothetical protein PPH41_41325, partial [Burkholderia gladioli]|nr:hypothetical protein [Burkholderia gladioli]
MAGDDGDRRREGRADTGACARAAAGRGEGMDGDRRMSDAVEKNPWGGLKTFTNARIALGRAGSSSASRLASDSLR